MELIEALEQVRAGADRPGGIGILGEKTLHAALKRWIDEDVTHHEILLPCGSVADVFDGERVTEIQTAGFSGFRGKLERLLAVYPVTVVHPLVRRKQVIWLDPATGEATPPHRSPRIGSFTDAGRELVYILPLLSDPRLTVRLVLLDMEEYRIADGWGRDGKRGSHRAERIPVGEPEVLDLTRPEDYTALIPPQLPDDFDAAAFGKAAKMSGRILGGTLKVLLAMEALTRDTGTRPYRYSIAHR